MFNSIIIQIYLTILRIILIMNRSLNPTQGNIKKSYISQKEYDVMSNSTNYNLANKTFDGNVSVKTVVNKVLDDLNEREKDLNQNKEQFNKLQDFKKEVSENYSNHNKKIRYIIENNIIKYENDMLSHYDNQFKKIENHKSLLLKLKKERDELQKDLFKLERKLKELENYVGE